MDNNGGGGCRNGREVERAGGWAGVGGKSREPYLNNNKIRGKKTHFPRSLWANLRVECEE